MGVRVFACLYAPSIYTYLIVVVQLKHWGPSIWMVVKLCVHVCIRVCVGVSVCISVCMCMCVCV